MARIPIDVMITAFRDGFQSVYGARVLTKDFLPAVEASVKAGLHHFEAGGGARFQSLYFYCNEDAFEMMDSFRRTAGPDANLQTLARGINVVGLDSQSSDIIRLHAQLFKKHGITTIRNFDALNDVDNLDYSGRCIVEAGLKHEICVTLMTLPPGVTGAHTPEFYMKVLKKILDAEIPFDSVCFKDASGTATPTTVYKTIKLARPKLPANVTIHFHTHETAGTSVLTYKAALDAGARAIDCSMAPVSGGTGQPDIVVMWHALRDTDYDLQIDIQKVLEAEEVFKECMKDYENLEEASKVDPLIPFSPMPGGALTANTQMMRDNNILDKFPDVIAAMGEVVARGGFGTSVTPVSQFYFQQAFNNVLLGPWKKIADGYGKMVLGYFGRTPVPPDPEIVKLAQEQLNLEPTTKSPRLLNDEDPKKGIEPAKAMLKEAGLAVSDENIFIAATCKEKGTAFLKGEAKVTVRKKSQNREGETKNETVAPAPEKREGMRNFDIFVNNEYFKVEIAEPDGRPTITAGGIPAPTVRQAAAPQLRQAAAAAKTVAAPAPRVISTGEGEVPVVAPLPGVIVRYEKKVGDSVRAGETVVIIEAMKMNNNIDSPCDGVVVQIPFEAGSSVAKANVLCVIKAS
ncbi:MAG TPA: biotin/lipoyl-containing protein [Spirochaetia bacterium]|nr:biotin/lipoyl-containing protein [Spirochaetia bacterium]